MKMDKAACVNVEVCYLLKGGGLSCTGGFSFLDHSSDFVNDSLCLLSSETSFAVVVCFSEPLSEIFLVLIGDSEAIELEIRIHSSLRLFLGDYFVII